MCPLDDCSGRSLVADCNFILATRDTGYRDIASAVSEVVDNAVEAAATTIHILVREERADGKRAISIAVTDDGHGMAAEELSTALQFGGSTRFNSRRGIGRFGMGLPNSSVSQSRRLDVYSRTEGGPRLHTYLDVDEVAKGVLCYVPEPVPAEIPHWIANVCRDHGTAVIWTRCDRLDFRKAITIRKKIASSISRRYRHLLIDGIAIYIDGIRVHPLDPLFLDAPLQARATPFGDPIPFAVRLPDSDSTVHIEARFSELPLARLAILSNHEKRELGVVGGAGVSFVRAGREVDYAWTLLGAKRKENYDDWWRCEVRFDPDADELFGITHSKQGVNPSQYLRDALEGELESVARQLNNRVRAAFQGLRLARPSRAEAAASRADVLLPVALGSPPVPERRDGILYRISYELLDTTAIFDASLVDGSLVVVLNKAHPFYTSLYWPLRMTAPKLADRLEALLAAAARAAVTAKGYPGQPVNQFLESWADAFAAFASEL